MMKLRWISQGGLDLFLGWVVLLALLLGLVLAGLEANSVTVGPERPRLMTVSRG